MKTLPCGQCKKPLSVPDQIPTTALALCGDCFEPVMRAQMPPRQLRMLTLGERMEALPAPYNRGAFELYLRLAGGYSDDPGAHALTDEELDMLDAFVSSHEGGQLQ